MILGIIQARLSSTRLPAKTMALIGARPMLALQLERVRRAELVDDWVVATSDEEGDKPIQILCEVLGVHCFRGSLRDVLQRFYAAARPFAPSRVLRLTGDCPLSDPVLIDAVIAAHLQSGSDYSSNALERSFPDGLDVEVMRWECLVRARMEADLPSQREHVTAYIYQHPEQFILESHKADADYSRHRWAVDHPEDLALLRVVFSELYATKPCFSWQDVLSLVETRPELALMNAMHDVNEGWNKSLIEDRKVDAGES